MHRTALGLVATLCALGCKKDTSFPMWQDGILVEGDCHDDYEIVDGTPTNSVAELPNSNNPSDQVGKDPLWTMDALPDPVGIVITDPAEYSALWNGTMNFGSWPAVDFETQQALFVWTRNVHSCNITVEDWHVNTKADLGVVLDVQFFDDALNCETTCETDSKAMVMVAIDKEIDASVCRRIRPGCAPVVTE